eukprot:6927850-Alexandrium_andersonii.AAC.1
MSASLVGSEMCIRDRSEPGVRGPPARRPRWAWRAMAVARGADAMSPVSYTHLTLPTICSV